MLQSFKVNHDKYKSFWLYGLNLLLINYIVCVHITLLYSSSGRTKDLYSLSMMSESLHSKTLCMRPKVQLALLVTMSVWTWNFNYSQYGLPGLTCPPRVQVQHLATYTDDYTLNSYINNVQQLTLKDKSHVLDHCTRTSVMLKLQIIFRWPNNPISDWIIRYPR